MTAPAELAGPSVYVTKFVAEAQRILARYPEADRRSARLRLTVIIGGGWVATAEGDECRLLGNGNDPDLNRAAQMLTKSSIAELDVQSRGRLMQSMHTNETEEPSHFRTSLVLEGATFELRVSAHCRGAGAVVGTVAGTLASEQAAA
jgi:hypothetical protein